MVKRIFCFICLITSVASVNAMKMYFKRKKMEGSRKKELFYKQKNGKLERNKNPFQKNLQNRRRLLNLGKEVAGKTKVEQKNLSLIMSIDQKNNSNGFQIPVLNNCEKIVIGISVHYNANQDFIEAWATFESESEKRLFINKVSVMKSMKDDSFMMSAMVSDPSKENCFFVTPDSLLVNVLKGNINTYKKKFYV